jgi:hypothetical protein
MVVFLSAIKKPANWAGRVKCVWFAVLGGDHRRFTARETDDAVPPREFVYLELNGGSSLL